MMGLVEKNINLAFTSLESRNFENGAAITENEKVIDFTNIALTNFLIKLSVDVGQSDENLIGSYFHVLNDLERIGDHAENFYEMGVEMNDKSIRFSEQAQKNLHEMYDKIIEMFAISKDAFENYKKDELPKLGALENDVDTMKRNLTTSHFMRLAEGSCSVECSQYYSSVVSGLERVADHLVNVGYSIMNPVGSQQEQN